MQCAKCQWVPRINQSMVWHQPIPLADGETHPSMTDAKNLTAGCRPSTARARDKRPRLRRECQRAPQLPEEERKNMRCGWLIDQKWSGAPLAPFPLQTKWEFLTKRQANQGPESGTPKTPNKQKPRLFCPPVGNPCGVNEKERERERERDRGMGAEGNDDDDNGTPQNNRG